MRPQPPADLAGIALKGASFVPAADLREWIAASFVDESGPLHNPDHAHLYAARIGVLWTNASASRDGREIVGQVEHRPPSVIGKWARARAIAQLEGWFGPDPLDFLLTFYAPYAAACSDRRFCALVEHELYHCGQARDEFGAPKFHRDSGLPVYCMRGHDFEQFTGVVARYGADAAGLSEAAAAIAVGPAIEDGPVRIACGSCG